MTRRRIRLALLALCVASIFVTYQLFNSAKLTTSKSSLVDTRIKWNSDGISDLPLSDVLTCRYPDLDPWDKKMMGFFKEHPRMKCPTDVKNWIEVIDGRFVIMPSATDDGKISCTYIPFTRESDHSTVEGAAVAIENNTLVKADFFRVKCTSSSGGSYENIHASIRKDEKLLNKKSSVKTGLGFDVLIIGFDSVSRMTFMRKMPKTFKYLTEVLGSIVLKGYNIVGDGTPQALIPIFTGKTELELPRPLKRLHNGLYANVFPMAWKDFSKMGYVTAWSEDQPDIGTFTYRMTGFKEQPTDHYMRTFFLKVDKSKHKPLCIGDRPRARVTLDWMRDFMRMYRNSSKFGFMFHSELSHDNSNMIQSSDDDLLETLKHLKENGLLDNTMLIVMSDHGARFSSVRSSLQGKQEERNPFFSFAFPASFKKNHPEAFDNFLANSEKLVTPFDIHPTLLDMLVFQGSGDGDKKQRSISLFKKIPLDRACSDAKVEPHWCNCLQWSPLSNDDARTLSAARALVKRMNEYTSAKRDLCVELTLQGVVRSAVFETAKEMLAFKKTVDYDGFKADLSDKTRSDTELLQITIVTAPNNGSYESTITRDVDSNVYTVNIDEISRINKYGNDPHCIYDTEEQLRKFCFCKDRLKV